MTTPDAEPLAIERLDRADAAAIAQLAALLVDAVDDGASVSFLPPLAPEVAADFWRDAFAGAGPGTIFLVVRDAEGIAATVNLAPAWAPNQPHRAEVNKLLVHRRARRRGVGRALMFALEAHARAASLTLLTLDTRRGDAAERLYRELGWREAGFIPDFAIDPRVPGTFGDTVIFYKRLDAPA